MTTAIRTMTIMAGGTAMVRARPARFFPANCVGRQLPDGDWSDDLEFCRRKTDPIAFLADRTLDAGKMHALPPQDPGLPMKDGTTRGLT